MIRLESETKKCSQKLKTKEKEIWDNEKLSVKKEMISAWTDFDHLLVDFLTGLKLFSFFILFQQIQNIWHVQCVSWYHNKKHILKKRRYILFVAIPSIRRGSFQALICFFYWSVYCGKVIDAAELVFVRSVILFNAWLQFNEIHLQICKHAIYSSR